MSMFPFHLLEMLLSLTRWHRMISRRDRQIWRILGKISIRMKYTMPRIDHKIKRYRANRCKCTPPMLQYRECPRTFRNTLRSIKMRKARAKRKTVILVKKVRSTRLKSFSTKQLRRSRSTTFIMRIRFQCMVMIRIISTHSWCRMNSKWIRRRAISRRSEIKFPSKII